MLTLNCIVKEYGKKGRKTTALKGINLTVQDGEFVAVMGTSGSGKTTLLNVVGGMDTITSGEYLLDDIHVEKMSRRELAVYRRENVAFVFQHFALMNQYTVYENVNMPLLMKNLTARQRKERVEAALHKTGIDDLSGRKPSQLSGGQQQRCAIARAVATNNSLLLADEPTGSLDSKTSLQIMELFKELHEEGKTILLVTHDKEVAAYADRILQIEDGVLS